MEGQVDFDVQFVRTIRIPQMGAVAAEMKQQMVSQAPGAAQVGMPFKSKEEVKTRHFFPTHCFFSVANGFCGEEKKGWGRLLQWQKTTTANSVTKYGSTASTTARFLR